MTLATSYPVPCMDRDRPMTNSIKVKVPGSKSITNRALLLATLAEGQTTLSGVLFSDDSRHFLGCVQALGFETEVDETNQIVTVRGLGGPLPKKEADLYVGSAGTAARFLTAYLGVSEGIYHMDASAQMRRRPMAPLLNVLSDLGCEIKAAEKEGYFPFTLISHGFQKNDVTVNIDESSQFLSALMISSCLSPNDFTIHLEGTHGMAYIEMTQKMMEQFGINILHPNPSTYVTPAGQQYRAQTYQIEPDVSAACYFYAMCPLLNVPVQVEGVAFQSLQGDMAFLSILEKMGCTCQEHENGILLLPPAAKSYPGVTVDMSACSDQAITLAAIAPFATSPTTITGIGHIRFQECDRLNAIATQLSSLGIRCETTDSSITIYPGNPRPGQVETYEDHRMAMGFSLIGLRAPGIVIQNPACCRKTFENYFETLEEAVSQLKAKP